MGLEAVTGFSIAGVVFFMIVLFNTIKIVDEYKRLVVLRLGKYQGTRGPGIVLLIPFLETATYVDLRERYLDVPAQTAITRDNASILIDFLVYYKITDPMLSVLKLDNVE
ncbi:MAG: SPFH domain-containing protein, partial [Chloroflexota bacterium]